MSQHRPNPGGQMSIMEHLGELRTRLMRTMVYIGIAFVVCFFLFNPVLRFIAEPFLKVKNLTTNELVGMGPLSAVSFKLKLVTYMAIGLAMPFILGELWGFVSPGMTSKEKRWTAPFFPVAFLLFCFGVVLGYLTLPSALEFMGGFAGEGFKLLPVADDYISLFTFYMLAFGLTFEFPVVLFILQASHVVTWRALLSGWRYAVVSIIVFAAVITPSQDPYTLVLMAVPMIVFYFGSILFGWLVLRERRSKQPSEAQA